MLYSLLFLIRPFTLYLKEYKGIFFFSSNKTYTQFHGTLFFYDKIQIAEFNYVFLCLKYQPVFFKTKDVVSGLMVLIER